MKYINNSFLKLKTYCEKEEYKGWDPYDGLNSKAFKSLPFKNWDIARLCWIQFFKLSPINFRKLFLVPKQYNSKGIALFLSGCMDTIADVPAAAVNGDSNVVGGVWGAVTSIF